MPGQRDGLNLILRAMRARPIETTGGSRKRVEREFLPNEFLRYTQLTVCPCCGFKFEGDLQIDGCASCGARAVGPALSRPIRELPSYGRSLLVGVMGGIMLITFLVTTIIALFERAPVSLGFWSIMGAAETAAWRLKWIAIPVSIIALWAGSLICRSIRRNPKRFTWSRVAHSGLSAVIVVVVLIVTLIGITVPDRLRQRELREEAAIYAQGYTIQRAFLDYRARYGTLPATLDELRSLPDPDNSIAAALAGIKDSAYSPGADLAALPKKKSRSLRGSALRNASLRSTDDAPAGGFSFTKYEMRLPGPDSKLGTEDDWTMRDGLIIKPIKAEEQTEATLPAAHQP
jgi:type II secretory pathway pseudopilin PulG